MAKGLFHLEHIAALQVANFGGEALQGGAHQGQGLHVISVAVAADHLGAGWIGPQPQQLTGPFFDLGLGVGVVAHGATDLAHAHGLLQSLEAFDVALGFSQPAGQLEAKGDRLAVDGVGAADHHGVFVGPCLHADGFCELVEFAAQQLHRGLELQRQAGVEHIGAGHAHVDVAPGIAHVFVHVGEEGDHVVAHLGLDLEDPLAAEGCFVLDRGEGFGGHAAQFRLGFANSDFNVQPALELGVFCPDPAHLRQGVALDQGFCSANRPNYPGLRLRRATSHWMAGPQAC